MYWVQFRKYLIPNLKLTTSREHLMLGTWWLQELKKGLVEMAPIVNVSPKMTQRSGCNICKKESIE